MARPRARFFGAQAAKIKTGPTIRVDVAMVFRSNALYPDTKAWEDKDFGMKANRVVDGVSPGLMPTGTVGRGIRPTGDGCGPAVDGVVA